MNEDCGTECQEALRDLQRFLDGELPQSRLSTIGQHLATCFPCTDRASFEEEFRRMVRRGCDDHAPHDLAARIRQRLDSIAPGTFAPGSPSFADGAPGDPSANPRDLPGFPGG